MTQARTSEEAGWTRAERVMTREMGDGLAYLHILQIHLTMESFPVTFIYLDSTRKTRFGSESLRTLNHSWLKTLCLAEGAGWPA